MEAASTPMGTFYRVLAWAERHKQKLIVSAAVVAVAGVGVWYYVWKEANAEATAGMELSGLRPTPTAAGGLIPVPASAYLKVAEDYPKSSAAARALLLGAGALFTEGKYDEAKAHFDGLLRDYPSSPYRSEAMYGNAACLEAQGKIAEATAAFRNIVERQPMAPVVQRAKLSLARLYQTQSQVEQAYRLFEDVLRAEGMSFVGYQAEMGLEELKRSHPHLAAPPEAGLSFPVPTLGTNQP